MFVLPVLVDPADDALALLLVVVVPVLGGPCQQVFHRCAEMIEQVGCMHHIVVVGAGAIRDLAPVEHLLDDGPG